MKLVEMEGGGETGLPVGSHNSYAVPLPEVVGEVLEQLSLHAVTRYSVLRRLELGHHTLIVIDIA